MQAKHKMAIMRLRKWSDPRTPGNPSLRMMQIWKSGPKEMAMDIHKLLELVDK